MKDVPGDEVQRNAVQAKIYQQMVEASIESGVVRSFILFGVGDRFSWIERDKSYSGYSTKGDPTPFNDSLQPKPAYFAMLQALFNYSGWAVGAGADGAALSCGSNYPNNADSNMVYGPFSLEDASAAELRFKLWTNTEWDYDELLVCASPVFFDYFPFWDCTGGEWTGTSTGWIEVVVDLESDFSYFDPLGQPEVWVMLNFISNQSTTYPEGIYVDNIVLRKCPLGGSCQ